MKELRVRRGEDEPTLEDEDLEEEDLEEKDLESCIDKLTDE